MLRSIFFAAMFVLCEDIALASEEFDLYEGDRVVLVGDTMIEREQESGWLETEMAVDFPDCHLIVRNLGWSADTPGGASRASIDYDNPATHRVDAKGADPSLVFADPQNGFPVLVEEIKTVRPTVVMLGYGMACSFSGQAGLAQFQSDLNRLMDTIQAQGTNPVRFVLISPIRHQKLPPPMPDPSRHNAQLELYTTAMREVAVRRWVPFVDLYHWQPSMKVGDLTDNGIHLTHAGYRELAKELARQLGWPRPVEKANKLVLNALREEIIQKNQLYFRQWRAQNGVYISGFRSQEQHIVQELPAYDPLVGKADEAIAGLRHELFSGNKSKGRAQLTPIEAGRPGKPWPLPTFTVAPGFEVTLWAQDPMLEKPVQINFDPQGRMWVATTTIYPQISPTQKADDKIFILEDTTGTGKADKSTVFADGLFMPLGVEPGDGGCYVSQGTELLHLTDTHGKGKADQRRVILSGFGNEDTHHLIHTVVWGPDGALYFNQGLYVHSMVETPNGVLRNNGGGIFRLRLDSMQMSVFLRGLFDTWGHAIDPFGQSFVSDASSFKGVSWGIRNAEYETYELMRRELQSISPGTYPKYCGMEIVASSQFPDDCQGNFVVADYRAHRVCRFSVRDEGSGYVTEQMPDLVSSDDVTFRPVDMKFGPDGALYVADWSNPIINHAEVDFRDSRRDHEHGRIWRIAAKNRRLVPRRNLTEIPTGKLFDELLSSNLYSVQQTRRVLTERGKKIAEDLWKWTARQNDPKAWLQALWLYQSLGLRKDALLDKVLQAPDGRIRAAAVRVLGFWPRTHIARSGPDKGLLMPDECYARALSDPFPRVRVEALRAIGSIPSLRSAELALDTINRPMDPFLDYSLWLTINELAKVWVAGLKSGAWSIAGREKQWNFALAAVKPDLTGGIFKRQPLRPDGPDSIIDLIGYSGSADDIDQLYHELLGDFFEPAAARRVVAALQEAASSRQIQPRSDLDKIVKLLNSHNENVRLSAINLTALWGGPGDSVSNLVALVRATGPTVADREAVFAALTKINGSKATDALKSLSDKSEPFDTRKSAILALAALDMRHYGAGTFLFLFSITNSPDALSTWRSLLSISGGDLAALDALPRNGLPRVVGIAGVRALRESGRNEPELIMALSRAAGLPDTVGELSKDEILALARNTLRKGIAANGERLFRSAQQSCMSCHSIGGVGGKVGPDLTSVGTSSPVDYLIESVLYPNKQIKEGYQAYMIETTDGKELTAIPLQENGRQLVMRTAEDQEVTILKSQIKTKKPGRSLMPSGLVDNLTAQEQLDLYRFLAELGKTGQFDASKGNVARLWKVRLDASDDAERNLLDSNPKGESWHRAISLSNGRMLVEDLETAAHLGLRTTNTTILAETQFRSVKAGPVQLNLSASAESVVWIDGQRIDPLPARNSSLPLPKPARTSVSASNRSISTTELSPGMYTIILRLTGRDASRSIRLQSDDVMFEGTTDWSK